MQVNLDFSSPKIVAGKKEKGLTFACSDDFIEFVNMMVKAKNNVSRSELLHRYVVEGLKKDIADTFMPEPHLDKSLRELLGKFK